MATVNPFDLLGDDDAEDPLQLIAAQQQKVPAQVKKAPAPVAQQQQSKPAAKLPTKPLPPAQAVREAKADSGRGGGRGGGRGYGRGRGFNRELANTENTFGNREFPGGQALGEEADAGKSNERRGVYVGPRGPFRGGRRGAFSNGELDDGERHRRAFDRRSGTGRGNEIKREGAGQGNWGIQTDELVQSSEEVVNEGGKNPNEKLPLVEEEKTDGNKETPANEAEEKEPENKEMTLEEYEKVLEEKKKALQSLKTEERKVDTKEFASMQQLTNKKSNDDVFVKLGSDKDKDKKKEAAERAKKAVSINEFLKPAEGEKYYSPGGRGRGRGRGGRGYGGGNSINNVEAPSIEDPGQFPTLSAK